MAKLDKYLRELSIKVGDEGRVEGGNIAVKLAKGAPRTGLPT